MATTLERFEHGSAFVCARKQLANHKLDMPLCKFALMRLIKLCCVATENNLKTS